MLQTSRQKNTLFWQGRRMVKMNIALDDIKSKAPEGATHYYQYKNGNLIYFKYFKDSGSLYRMTPNWTATSFVLEKLKPL